MAGMTTKTTRRWSLKGHFWMTVMLGFSAVVLYSIALYWGTDVPVHHDTRVPHRLPAEWVLDPPDSHSLYPMPFER